MFDLTRPWPPGLSRRNGVLLDCGLRGADRGALLARSTAFASSAPGCPSRSGPASAGSRSGASPTGSSTRHWCCWSPSLLLRFLPMPRLRAGFGQLAAVRLRLPRRRPAGPGLDPAEAPHRSRPARGLSAGGCRWLPLEPVGLRLPELSVRPRHHVVRPGNGGRLPLAAAASGAACARRGGPDRLLPDRRGGALPHRRHGRRRARHAGRLRRPQRLRVAQLALHGRGRTHRPPALLPVAALFRRP
jgi:hypothetical protein